MENNGKGKSAAKVRFRVFNSGGLLGTYQKFFEAAHAAAHEAIRTKSNVEVFDLLAQRGNPHIWTFDKNGDSTVLEYKPVTSQLSRKNEYVRGK